MSINILRPFIVKVSVLGYFPLLTLICAYIIHTIYRGIEGKLYPYDYNIIFILSSWMG